MAVTLGVAPWHYAPFAIFSVATEKQFFNLMDPAPFRKRELDPAVVDFIVAWAENAPGSADIGLILRVESPPTNVDVQAVVSEAVC